MDACNWEFPQEHKAHTLIQNGGSKSSGRDGEDRREARGPRADHNRTFESKKTMKTVMAELDQFGGDQGGSCWTDAYSYTSCSRTWHRRRFARPLRAVHPMGRRAVGIEWEENWSFEAKGGGRKHCWSWENESSACKG
ncbi:hypothetical protein GOBAR_AA29583 [Gossypium barbadense]|uniref:Uncharacterized protein n=1 Tax=Gossypium barbadense TaxID=3634 RepID=A0A2P5WJ36_GOSBA|nr:hypothetical protein GOBAR_AA29583 [Gossypium barbadense]